MKKRTLSLISLTLFVSASTQAASHNKMVFLNQYDLDGDWALYSDEFNHARFKRYSRTDEDGNQSVNIDEYVLEYQNHLDQQIAHDRKIQIRQTNVRFEAMDRNENSKMEWEEYEASGLRSFTRYDTNNDGQIDDTDALPEPRRAPKSESELTAKEREERRDRSLAFAKRVLRMPTTHNKQGMMTKYDTNEDGVITKTEHTQAREAAFVLTDEDANGWLTADEYLNEYLNRVDRQIAKTRKQAVKQTYVRFDALDTNDDGELTFEEYQASGQRMFTRWDTDNNKIVTMQEAMPQSSAE